MRLHEAQICLHATYAHLNLVLDFILWGNWTLPNTSPPAAVSATRVVLVRQNRMGKPIKAARQSTTHY
jgi:hypothetical protein